jgi:hypothetical protein
MADDGSVLPPWTPRTHVNTGSSAQREISVRGHPVILHGKLLRVPGLIGVQKRHVLPCGAVPPSVSSRSWTQPAFQEHGLDSLYMGETCLKLQQLVMSGVAIWAPIIHKNDLARPHALSDDRQESPLNRVITAVTGNDD